MEWTAIIQTVDRNMREDAVLQTRAGNALTMSGQHACYNRQIALVSYHIGQMVRELSLCRVLTNVKTSEKIRKAEVQFAICQAARDVS